DMMPAGSLRHAHLAVGSATARAAAAERRVRLLLAEAALVIAVDVGGLAAQEAHHHARALERGAHLREVAAALALHRAAVGVGLAQVRAVAALHAIEADRIAVQ